MGKNAKKRREVKKWRSTSIVLDYYTLPFAELHQELMEHYKLPDYPIERSNFWNMTPYDLYDPLTGREIIFAYLQVIEREMSEALMQNSLAYWLHAYRRIAPRPAGPNKSPTTLLTMRGIFETAIQKYSSLVPCEGIGSSKLISIDKVLGGRLMRPELKIVRNMLEEKEQLVLTDFGVANLKELYRLEQLAYEIWKCAANLRILGKGSSLKVLRSPINFTDDRTDDLDKVINIYDIRQQAFHTSATGTVFPNIPQDRHDMVIIARYNGDQISVENHQEFFKVFKLNLEPSFVPNFIWTTFNLGGYVRAHLPFAESFEQKYGISLHWIFAVLEAVLKRTIGVFAGSSAAAAHFLQRAYEGPILRHSYYDEILNILHNMKYRIVDTVDVKEIDIPKVVECFELTETKRKQIDLLLWGPHSIFFPFGKDRIFIDYAWIVEILYNLFYGVKPSDQNFKGEALEILVRKKGSVLPVGQCRALNGEKKQIDGAFEIDGSLVIVECKAVWRSFGIERGDPSALSYRSKLIDSAISQVDEKAIWLKNNPIGSNYDVRKYSKILPLVVTPFVEYVASLDAQYWLDDNTPRILTPSELDDYLSDGTLTKAIVKSVNCIEISAKN